MIDTIEIIIHNVRNYKTIYERFYSAQKAKGEYTEAFVNTETAEYVERSYSHSMLFHDNHSVIPIRHRSSMLIPSSHYSLSYLLDDKADTLAFNFSIPKYEYATNLFQFVDMSEPKSGQLLYAKLMKFFDDFFRYTLQEKPLLDDVEIKRIDLCYNQFFEDKDAAMQYLNEQNKLIVKYARSSKNKFRAYDSSVMYVTRRYSFKIYHKGTEFEKNDKKELQKNKAVYYPVDRLQSEADRILRYEMTFRKSFFNYILERFYYKKEAIDANLSNSRLYRFFAHGVSYGMQSDAENYFMRQKDFFLKSEWDYPGIVPNLQRSACSFDNILFGILVGIFWQKIKDYQVKRKIDVAEINTRIDKLLEFRDNKRASVEKLSKGRLRLMTAALLTHYMNIEELKKFIPSTSYNRLVRDLSQIGISTSNHDLPIPEPPLDYTDYAVFRLHYLKNVYD